MKADKNFDFNELAGIVMPGSIVIPGLANVTEIKFSADTKAPAKEVQE